MAELLIKADDKRIGLNSGFISKIINQIKGEENEARQKISLRETDVYNDKIYKFVKDYLEREAKLSGNTIDEIPICGAINLAKRIVDQEASIYKKAPSREFTNLSDDQRSTVDLMYKDFKINQKLKFSNQAYKLQKQCHVMLKPKHGKIMPIILRNHNIDVIPDPSDPETALVYIISIFDQAQLHLDIARDERRWRKDIDNTRTNKQIGDAQDYKSVINRYLIWSKDYQFVIDENRNIVLDTEEDINSDGTLRPESIENPLKDAQEIPIYDISGEKNFRYFIDEGNAIVDFTIGFNGDWSMLAQVQKMQGFAQAIIKGDPDALPKDMRIGPNYILYLPTTQSANGTPIETDFDYRNPNTDLKGNLEVIQSKLASFLTSRGLDPQLVTGDISASGTYTSGIERLLAMIEKFDATRDDYDLFENVEDDIYRGIKAWHNVLKGTDLLKKKYQTSELPESSEVSVKFEAPEMIQTEKELVELSMLKVKEGLGSRVDAIESVFNVDRDQAELIMVRIDKDNKKEENKRMESFLLSETAFNRGEDGKESKGIDIKPTGSEPDV